MMDLESVEVTSVISLMPTSDLIPSVIVEDMVTSMATAENRPAYL